MDYTLEEVDEEEVLREEILWQDNATTDISPTSILTRDFGAIESLAQTR